MIYSDAPRLIRLIFSAQNRNAVVIVARAPRTVTAITGFRLSGVSSGYVTVILNRNSQDYYPLLPVQSRDS